ncbi:MAG: caspase family protein [Pirellulaceae bacterium]
MLRVAFSKSDPPYRIAFGTQRGSDGRVILNRSFDLAQVRLESRSQLNDADWLSLVTPPADWNLRTIPTSYGETYWLFRGQKQVAQLPLRPELHGRPSATCWIADAQGQPFAVAVGTALQGNIYVFRLEAADEARLMRQFRGHEGGVRSISMSQDRRYLVSASDDATIRVWNLAGFETESDLTNRWGGELQVQNGELAVVSLREDGPFYFRGFRVGDVIDALLWMDSRDGKTKQSTDPEVMLNVLRTAGPDAQIVFEYRRREMAQPVMQLLPAWQQLAALFVAENREWAFWTPAGFYDASFEGHKLFGWQVNRGLQLLPEFFLAAQFQQALERPQVMAHLLNAGSLEAAFRAAQQPPPANAQNAVGDQYRLKPRVEIIAPQPDALVSGATPVEARITVRDGLQLTPPKAFANGVVAPRRRLVDVQATEGGFTYHYAWDAQLPSNARVVIQVVASTDAAVVDTQSVVVRQDVGSRRPARLYVVAAGVNQYRDAQIQRLDFATSNARSLIDTLQSRARGLYESEATMLVDDQVTRPMWTVVSRAYAERLRTEAGPDDLLVFFLSGHGVRDEETSRYYFVAANARYDDVKSQRFGDCLAFEDFAAFADVPCRKLVVLDTCHSGAVQQPLRQQDLKAALRALQTDVVFTLTASEGSQEAAEERGRRLGRFTSRLLEALSGAADQKVAGGNGDQVVTLQETYQYVSSALAADSVDSATIQHPTVGPIDLLDFAVLPLAAGG